MSGLNAAMDVYLTGLRNQHAVETQAIGTIQNQLPRMESYTELHAKMQQDKQQSETQAGRLDSLLAKHDTKKSGLKEVVTGTVATVAGLAHAPASDEVLKNVLSAIGYKAYEIGSYKMLVDTRQPVRRVGRRGGARAVHEGGAGDGRLARQPSARHRAGLPEPQAGLTVPLRTDRGGRAGPGRRYVLCGSTLLNP